MRRPHSLLGKSAPSFSLPNFNGENFTFTPGSTGRPAALFFYPKSGAFISTREACQFRDYLLEKDLFKKSGIQIIGISPDSLERQKDFVEKQHLNYPILSDTRGDARRAYEVHKGLLGLNESSRLTFFIDSSGVVKDVFNTPLNVGNHVKFVYRWLARLAGEPMTDEMMHETMSDTMSIAGMSNNVAGMEEAMSDTVDNIMSDGNMPVVGALNTNGAAGLPTYAATVEQSDSPNSNVQSSTAPIFDRMTADRMNADSAVAVNTVDTGTVVQMSPMTPQAMAHAGCPPGSHAMMSESVSTNSMAGSNSDMIPSSPTTVMNSPLIGSMSAFHGPMSSSTTDENNMHDSLKQIPNTAFPPPMMDTHMNHTNYMPMSDNHDRQERISLGDTSVTDIHPNTAISPADHMSMMHHHHAGCDCTCHTIRNMSSKFTTTEASTVLTAMHGTMSDIATTVDSMIGLEKTLSKTQPLSASRDTMALSITGALGIDEKGPLQGKTAADDAALQSLLAIYGRTENQEAIDPAVTDPLAQSILSAALGYYRT